MPTTTIPLERYPNLPPLFLDFVRGGSPFYPDPPSLEAALSRGRELLARGARSKLSAGAYRYRGNAGRRAAEDLAAGRAVAVLAGHQIGLLTGPLFTLVKAFDAIAIARQMTELGVPAVPVFWALTDDHDLEEIAKTAKPGPDGPERLVLEGADRSNRRPVGTVPIRDGVREILESFRADARDDAPVSEIAHRYTPGAAYGEAFIEALLDATDGAGDSPLLVLDPLGDEPAAAAREMFLAGVERRDPVAAALRDRAAGIERAGRSPVVPFRDDVFPFFAIEDGARRRVEPQRIASVADRVTRGEVAISADVLTRPVLKSRILPAAASVLGPSEIAYHAQSLALFDVLGATVPVLLPRTLAVLRGPAERRAQEALGIPDADLLAPEGVAGAGTPVPQADRLAEIARRLEEELALLGGSVGDLDATLTGALETARRKATYQLEQLGERMRKAAERKDEVTRSRRRRLETMIRPFGEPAERVYPPLVFHLAWGDSALEAIRAAAGSISGGVSLVDVEVAAGAEAMKIRAG